MIKKIFWIILALIIVFSLLFIYKQNLFDTKSAINAERFAHYSTFISLFLNLLTIGLLFYTYQQTRNSHNLTVSTFEQTRKDSIDATFFNLIQNYRTIVERLHNRITTSLVSEFVRLNEQKGNYFDVTITHDKDFFELIYRILHFEYKEKETSRDITKVTGFFKNYNWIMGHYIRSVLYFIKWVDQKRN
jgi:hypothetical protein